MDPNVEPMDVDDIEIGFDNKENSLHHSNVLPRTEKGYDELEVSEMSMKLRYSITPTSSPMSKSFNVNSLDNRNASSMDSSGLLDNGNMTKSLNTPTAKTLPLQLLTDEKLPLRSLDTIDPNDITITVETVDDLDDNVSYPSTSSSSIHTPEVTTPTKDFPKPESGSPIIRGLKSVLNMFRSSESPVPPDNNDNDNIALGSESLSPDLVHSPKNIDNINITASTPLGLHKNKATSLRSSPNKERLTFNEDLEKELEWKGDTTIIFSQEKVPIHKLFFHNSKSEAKNYESENQENNLNSTPEYMDISYNNSIQTNVSVIENNNCDKLYEKDELVTPVDSDSEFLDCETTFTKNKSLKVEHHDIVSSDIINLEKSLDKRKSEIVETLSNNSILNDNGDSCDIKEKIEFNQNIDCKWSANISNDNKSQPDNENNILCDLDNINKSVNEIIKSDYCEEITINNPVENDDIKESLQNIGANTLNYIPFEALNTSGNVCNDALGHDKSCNYESNKSFNIDCCEGSLSNENKTISYNINTNKSVESGESEMFVCDKTKDENESIVINNNNKEDSENIRLAQNNEHVTHVANAELYHTDTLIKKYDISNSKLSIIENSDIKLDNINAQDKNEGNDNSMNYDNSTEIAGAVENIQFSQNNPELNEDHINCNEIKSCHSQDDCNEVDINTQANEVKSNDVFVDSCKNILNLSLSIDIKTEPKESINSITFQNSPPIVSKGYNVNFDEDVNPFVTKTKIRMSPPLDNHYILKNDTKENLKIHTESIVKTPSYLNKNKRNSIVNKLNRKGSNSLTEAAIDNSTITPNFEIVDNISEFYNLEKVNDNVISDSKADENINNQINHESFVLTESKQTPSDHSTTEAVSEKEILDYDLKPCGTIDKSILQQAQTSGHSTTEALFEKENVANDLKPCETMDKSMLQQSQTPSDHTTTETVSENDFKPCEIIDKSMLQQSQTPSDTVSEKEILEYDLKPSDHTTTETVSEKESLENDLKPFGTMDKSMLQQSQISSDHTTTETVSEKEILQNDLKPCATVDKSMLEQSQIPLDLTTTETVSEKEILENDFKSCVPISASINLKEAVIDDTIIANNFGSVLPCEKMVGNSDYIVEDCMTPEINHIACINEKNQNIPDLIEATKSSTDDLTYLPTGSLLSNNKMDNDLLTQIETPLKLNIADKYSNNENSDESLSEPLISRLEKNKLDSTDCFMENNVTVCEINTEDEDTEEGPFLEDEINNECEKIINITTENVDIDDINNVRDSEEIDNDEIFIDAQAFDFLMNQNKFNEVADSGKESLFLKFDPLFARRMTSDNFNNVQKRQSTPKKKNNDLYLKKSLEAGPSHIASASEGFSNVMDTNEVDLNTMVSKPTMIVNPAVNSVAAQTKSVTPPRANRLSMTFTSPAIAVIDRLLSMSTNSPTNLDTTVTHSNNQHESDIALIQLRELLADKEVSVQQLRTESQEIKNKLYDVESKVRSLETEGKERLKNIKELNQKLEEKTQINRKMGSVVEEYERTIASLIADIEQDKKSHTQERMQLIQERDEQTAHLTSMEVSFSDLHSKYEKSKQVIFGYRDNEEKYKKSIDEFAENLSKMQNNYELLKQHATAKLNHANQELEKINKSHEADVLKMNAMIKRKDMQISSLEETLAQKTKANEELTAICDELINKVGYK